MALEIRNCSAPVGDLLPGVYVVARSTVASAEIAVIVYEHHKSTMGECSCIGFQAMFFDAGKAVRELGLPQTPVEDALDRAVHWFSDHGYAKKWVH